MKTSQLPYPDSSHVDLSKLFYVLFVFLFHGKPGAINAWHCEQSLELSAETDSSADEVSSAKADAIKRVRKVAQLSVPDRHAFAPFLVGLLCLLSIPPCLAG